MATAFGHAGWARAALPKAAHAGLPACAPDSPTRPAPPCAALSQPARPMTTTSAQTRRRPQSHPRRYRDPHPRAARDSLDYEDETHQPHHDTLAQNWAIGTPRHDEGGLSRRDPDSAGRMWVSASGPASVVLRWCGRRVGGLGPGLTSDSADAARAVLLTICRPGPGFQAPTGTAGLICLAWTRGRGFTGPTASGCVPPLQPEEKRWH
jgi:hypothetical protein